jgi:hypothetical protein
MWTPATDFRTVPPEIWAVGSHATLFRILEQLVMDRWISVARYSTGRSSTRYAKLPEPAEETV